MKTKTKNIDRYRYVVHHHIWTVSNLFSFSRVPATGAFIYLDYFHAVSNYVLVGIVVYTIVSDMLDGWLARYLDQITEAGKVLDPIADKITAALLFSYAVFIQAIPWEVLVFSLVRDFSISAGSLYIRRDRGKVPMSVMSGKITVNVMALYWVAAFFFPQYETVVSVLMWSSVAVMLYSWYDYGRRFYLIKQGAEFN